MTRTRPFHSARSVSHRPAAQPQPTAGEPASSTTTGPLGHLTWSVGATACVVQQAVAAICSSLQASSQGLQPRCLPCLYTSACSAQRPLGIHHVPIPHMQPTDGYVATPPAHVTCDMCHLVASVLSLRASQSKAQALLQCAIATRGCGRGAPRLADTSSLHTVPWSYHQAGLYQCLPAAAMLAHLAQPPLAPAAGPAASPAPASWPHILCCGTCTSPGLLSTWWSSWGTCPAA